VQLHNLIDAGQRELVFHRYLRACVSACMDFSYYFSITRGIVGAARDWFFY
jgi:hypothetical protein